MKYIVEIKVEYNKALFKFDTAKEAGMDGIFVNWGFRGREFLLEHGAKCVVDTPEELERLLTGKA